MIVLCVFGILFAALFSLGVLAGLKDLGAL